MFVIRIRELPEFLMMLDDFKIFDLMLAKLKAGPEEVEAYKYTYRTYGKIFEKYQSLKILKNNILLNMISEHRNCPLNYYRANFLRNSQDKETVTAAGLNELKVPGLYIHGNDDPALTVNVSYTKSFEDVENVKYVNIPNADHFVHITSPQKVNEIMKEFLHS